MTLTELQVLIGSLTNDPNNDRYSLPSVTQELNITMNVWNVEVKVLRTVSLITVIDGQRQYSFIGLISRVPVAFGRVTHKGLDLKKRSKAYFDLYYGDWTTDIGTPIEFCIEATDPNNLYLTLHPTPQSGDAGANMYVESIVVPNDMTAASDVPYLLGTTSNLLLRPYDYYLAYETAGRLLARDPSELNASRAGNYMKIANDGKSNLIQVFKALEADEPSRIYGGRYWNSGNVQLPK